MQENDLRQEKKYCSRLGWSLVLTLACVLVWQVLLMLAGFAGMLNADATTYYLLALVGTISSRCRCVTGCAGRRPRRRSRAAGQRRGSSGGGL